MNETEQKQLYVYLRPLLEGIDKKAFSQLSFPNIDFSEDLVIIGKKNYSKEVFINILLSFKKELSYKFISMYHLSEIASTKIVTEDYPSLGDLTSMQILFIESGGYGMSFVPHLGNIIDVLVSTRRSLGLHTYIYHMGTKEEYLSYNSTLMTSTMSLGKKGGSSI